MSWLKCGPVGSAAWLHSSDSARDKQGMGNLMVPSATLKSQHHILGSKTYSKPPNPDVYL